MYQDLCHQYVGYSPNGKEFCSDYDIVVMD